MPAATYLGAISILFQLSNETPEEEQLKLRPNKKSLVSTWVSIVNRKQALVGGASSKDEENLILHPQLHSKKRNGPRAECQGPSDLWGWWQ